MTTKTFNTGDKVYHRVHKAWNPCTIERIDGDSVLLKTRDNIAVVSWVENIEQADSKGNKYE